jgi:predicted amidohydrolase YtcJ
MAARLTTYVVVAIVAATLIAGLIVGAQRDDSDGPVDLIVHNGKVYTAGASGTFEEAVAVRGNQILRVGSNREIKRLQRPQTVVIDAKGGAVLPGFNDSHVHLVDGGLALDALDVSGAVTIDEIQQQIRDWADANPDAPWVVGRGWSFDMFAGGLPTRQMLDAAVPNRPAQILSNDGRALWVNTKALHVARINRHTPDPPYGAIVREPRSGEPSGVLREAAVTLITRRAPATRDDRGRALRAAIAEAHRNGVTSVQDAGASEADLELYESARRAGDLQLRVYSAFDIGTSLDEADLRRIESITAKYPDDPVFKAGAVQIALDGAVESRSAAMLEPYATGDEAPEPRIAPDDLNRMVRLLDARGWQVMIDAFGDRAVRMALDAFDHAVRSNPAPKRGRRHRVEHVEIVHPADVPRFARAGVIASMQPFDGSPSPAQTELWTRVVGPDRAARGWAYKSIAGRRGRLAFGSDWPAVPLTPMLGLHTAVNRTTVDGSPDDPWYPSERLPLARAINAFTSDAAWASFDEQRKGTLTAGMLADVVVLSGDIFETPASHLSSTAVAVTIFDGKVVYRRDDKLSTQPPPQ